MGRVLQNESAVNASNKSLIVKQALFVQTMDFCFYVFLVVEGHLLGPHKERSD